MAGVFKTSIRVEKDAVFGVVFDRYDEMMISLDGPFTEGTIVVKMTQENWYSLCESVGTAIIKKMKKEGNA